MKVPKVSIIIPCFNQSHYLDETLQSVYKQDYSNWECLIIDDGSNDNSAAIALQWCERDSRYQLLQKENGGPSSARNYGLQSCSGDYIQFLDGDDLLYPSKLSKSLPNPENNAEVVITSFNLLKRGRLEGPYCNLAPHNFTYDHILLRWDRGFSIPIHCGLFKRELLDGFLFDEEVQAGEDWIFWLFLYKKHPQTRFINEELVCYRFHDTNNSADESYMPAKKQLAHVKIYLGLTEDYRLRYFQRFSDEALSFRTQFAQIQKKKDRKISRRIKKFFRGRHK